jgi:hypothetical protein
MTFGLLLVCAAVADKAEKLIAISITLRKRELKDVDARAKALDINRSQYFRRVARQEQLEAKRAALLDKAQLARSVALKAA